MPDFSKISINGTSYNVKDSQARTLIASEESARIAGDSATNNRIDNLIITSGGSDVTEVVDARIGATGTAYTVLKSRLDTEYNITHNKINSQNSALQASIATEISKREGVDKTLRTDVDMLVDTLMVKDPGYLVDKYGLFLTDQADNYLLGTRYHPKTDETGGVFGIPADSSVVGKTFLMGIPNMDIPIMKLVHPDIETLKSKGDGALSDVDIEFRYRNIITTLKKLKVQGASSQGYPKKNYTITFNDNVVLDEKWGAHKKYVIKADWVDFSHMRNEIGAKLWGKVRKSRINPKRSEFVNENNEYLVDGNGSNLVGDNDKSMSIGLNYGAVDGYPICLYINGTYWGIYSLMIPKDDWMAGMNGDALHEAIVAAETHSVPTQFNGLVEDPNEDGEMYDTNHIGVAYSMEYVTDDEDMLWLSASLNTMIGAIMATYNTPEECLETIGQYIDIDSAVDYMIFNCIINNIDGLDKNFLLDTWDGVKWYFAAYDMDGSFGNNWDGKSYIPIKGGCTFAEYANTSRLMRILYDYAPDIIKARYQELRKKALSEASFTDMVWNYTINIPDSAFNYETVRWPSRPGTHTNNYEQILRYYSMRCTALDAEIETL